MHYSITPTLASQLGRRGSCIHPCMADLSGAVQWWDEWKLRVLVLCSLFVQIFLSFSLWVRRLYYLRRLKVLVWVAYVGGDALAIYTLATLFNRQKPQPTADGGNSDLEVLWAPILLIHLGGQPMISAYSIEDNELWKRHAITLVSQVAVALYVFCRWWSGEKRLLQAAVLLFVVGIIRFGQKPWALSRASFNTMASENLSATRVRRWYNLFLIIDVRKIAWVKKHIKDEPDLQVYVQKAKMRLRKTLMEARGSVQEEMINVNKHSGRSMDYIYMYKMFVDLSTPYSLRLKFLKSLLKLDDKHEHQMLRLWITSAFVDLYTKFRSVRTFLGNFLWALVPSLGLSSVVLFAKSDKDGYNEKDIKVTYILLCCTTLNDLLSFLFIPCIIWSRDAWTWQDMVSQHSLMHFCARKNKPTIPMKLAALICLREYINKHWYIWQVPAALQITGLVREYVKDGWEQHIIDPATYRRFNKLRGQQTLKKHHQLGQVGWSLNLPFDEIVLLWHMATDLCFHHPGTSSLGRQGDTTQRSREVSNYMIYLLFICPDMLMPGTRQDLFTVACDDIVKLMLTDQDDPASIAQRILSMEHGDINGAMVPNAHRLAKALMDLSDEKERWMVIQGVWVEMLCYSASRCRGYLHAKSLGEGGEYLTNVWFLWSLMGMEIFGDKIHIPDQLSQAEEEETDAASV